MPVPYPLRRKFEKWYFITTDPSAEITGQTDEDREWLWIIPGRWGHVYIQGEKKLAAFLNKSPTSIRGQRLLEVLSAEPHQMGDDECTVLIDPVDLEAVAPILGLRKRRKLSDETRQRLAEGMGAVREQKRTSNHVQNEGIDDGNSDNG